VLSGELGADLLLVHVRPPLDFEYLYVETMSLEMKYLDVKSFSKKNQRDGKDR
jgi:hypothetical protein